MTGRHVHDMQPDRLVKPTVYGCSSCAFRCTPRSLSAVKARTGEHIVVRARKGQKPPVWDGAKS